MKDTEAAVNHLKSEGYYIVAVEQAEGSTMLQDFSLPFGSKMAIVFGNEVNGVSQGVMDQVHECVEVPQFGTKHSLNISVCIGVIVWELFKKLKFS